MYRKLCFVMLLLITMTTSTVFAQSNSNSYTIYVPLKAYDKNGFLGDGKLKIDKFRNGEYNLIATFEEDGVKRGALAHINKQNNACISTQGTDNGYRWWISSAYVSNDQIISYFVVVFDSSTRSLFFKEAPADKSSLSESHYMFVFSKSDYDNIIFKKFVFPLTDEIRIVPQMELFGDGIKRNY